jgi:hypothetical protein
MGWQYDDKYQLQSYTFSGIDKASLSNVPSRDARLYAYAIMAYVVTFICFWLWWRYNLEALRCAYSITAYVVTFICFWLWWRYNLEARSGERVWGCGLARAAQAAVLPWPFLPQAPHLLPAALASWRPETLTVSPATPPSPPAGSALSTCCTRQLALRR